MKKRFVTAIATAIALILGTGTAAALTHTVQSGDTLSRIATRYNVAGGWEAVYDANRSVIGPNPNYIEVGQVLTIPGADPTPTPTPTPAPANGTGVYEGKDDIAGVDAFGAWLNRAVIATDYVSAAETAKNAVSLKAWGDWKRAKPGRQFVLGLPSLAGGTYSDALAGKYDAQFRTLAQQLKDNGLGDATIRLGYEANNPSIGIWQATKQPWSFRETFKRYQRIMEAVSPEFKWDLNFMLGQSGWVTSFSVLYPGDAYVDIVSVNVYDMGGSSLTPYRRWQNLLNNSMGINALKSFARSHGKPYAFPEWGLYKKGDGYGGGGDSPYFIDRMAEQAAGAKYHSYFNANFTSLGSHLDMFPNAKARFKTKFGAP